MGSYQQMCCHIRKKAISPNRNYYRIYFDFIPFLIQISYICIINKKYREAMKYKLLVLDVDGTLLNNQKEISPRTLAALLKVQQMGVHIVLASGRPTNGVMPIAEKLELNHYGGYILS